MHSARSTGCLLGTTIMTQFLSLYTVWILHQVWNGISRRKQWTYLIGQPISVPNRYNEYLYLYLYNERNRIPFYLEEQQTMILFYLISRYNIRISLELVKKFKVFVGKLTLAPERRWGQIFRHKDHIPALHSATNR